MPSPKLSAHCLAEVKEASSAGAGAAFAQFVGAVLVARKPVVRAAGEPLESGVWKTGIFFEIQGELEGDIAILLTPPTRGAVTAVLEGMLQGPPSADACESIVLELGNIVASRIVSAIADRMKGRLVLSIPHMVTDGVERELAWRTRDITGSPLTARRSRFETEFVDRSGRLRALVVLVPDLPDAHFEEAFDTVES